MPDWHFSDSTDGGVEFLLSDLDLALTFMDVAATSNIQVRIDGNHRNARQAYDTVLRLLSYHTPDAEQRCAIDRKMALLKTRLQAVGYQF